MAWFPERDSLVVFNNDRLIELPRTTNEWTALGSSLGESHDIHTYAEYSPVDQIILFGGGYASSYKRSFFKVNAAGTITAVASPPFDIEEAGDSPILMADPVNGDFLVLTPTDGLWKYDVGADSWSQLQTFAQTFDRLETIGGCIPEYAVCMFIDAHGAVPATTWLYKL